MNALDQLQQTKTWLEQADEKTIDAFSSQHATLVQLFAETLLNFRRGIENVKIRMPTESTTVQKTALTIQLDNAKQDEPYFCKQNDNVLIKEVHFSQACGLSWNTEQKAIEGTPTISGEVQLSFLLENSHTALGTLWINPNPQKLWNNIPSDPKERFWKADSASGEISTTFGKLLAARMRGRSHAHKGTCCDDDFAMTFHPKSGVHFIAVADGAGSAEFSRLGSKLAVEAAKKKVLEQLEQNEKYQALASFSEMDKLKGVANGLLFQAVQAAFLAQESAAEKEQVPVKSLSCTLLLALTLPLENKQWFTACYWVGDGAAITLDLGSPRVKLLGEVDTGSYSGETIFLNRTEIEPEKLISRICTDLQDYPPILMLMTDGVSDPKFKTDAKLQTVETWQDLWNELKLPLRAENPSKTLEQWLDFWSKGEHDDRTLAMFIPQSEWVGLINQQQNLTDCEKNQMTLLVNEPTGSVQKNSEDKLLENVEGVAQEAIKEGIEKSGERIINVTCNNITTTITLEKVSDRALDNQGVNQ